MTKTIELAAGFIERAAFNHASELERFAELVRADESEQGVRDD